MKTINLINMAALYINIGVFCFYLYLIRRIRKQIKEVERLQDETIISLERTQVLHEEFRKRQ